MARTELDVLHENIDRCRMCEGLVDGFAKPPHLERGEGGRIMVVGQGPGNAELRGARAFAGQSGRTLDSWLRSVTGNEQNPRHGMYFTSVIKCCHSRSRDFSLMARNCSRFLQQQIATLEPGLVITLGKEAYEHLRFAPVSYEEALCSAFRSSDYLLISQFRFDFWLLPWPHPSGLNRWRNSAENRERLVGSFSFVRRALEGDLEGKQGS